MWKKLVQIVSGEECDLRERMLRTIILIGGLATIVGIVEIPILFEMSNVLVPMLLFLLATMGASLYVTFKYRKYDIGSMLIGLVIIVMVFPIMFFLSGGIDSGATIWMTLGIVYIFMMFTGKKMVFFLVLCIIVYGATYVLAYLKPVLIVAMESERLVYVDSFFSVVVVGLCIGLIMKIQMKVFDEEHKLNIRQREELERNSAAKNIFFANMSHEIRTPINAIIGLNEMILRENSKGQTAEYARDIQLASKMLLNQVNDILDLSQMEMKKMKIVPVQYHPQELFGELVELTRVQMEKKGLELIVDVEPGIPSVLFGDEKRLKQVILNLLDNATKYTKEGSVSLLVSGERVEGNQLILKVEVEDTGIGIRKEDLEYIYDSFNRVDENKNTRIVGSGLGLAITKQLVDLMDGEITVDSIYTKGTTFTVTLKQQIENDTPIGEVNFLKRSVGTGEYYRPSFVAPEARILVVDDNDMNALVASKLLGSTKVSVDVAKSGAECLEMTRKKFYHVVLLDYMMPGMNGAQTLKLLREQENGLCRESAVIVLTAHAVSEAIQLYMDMGFDGYVEKPIDGKAMEAELLKFLPADVVEHLENDQSDNMGQDITSKRVTRKRKKIYVTADCTCDIPPELLEKYDIRLMYLYIKTPQGRFADTREIDSDSLKYYMTPEKTTAYSDSVTVEEFEEFFAEALTLADRIVHISLGSGMGNSYSRALEAAKGFDHVHVVDSGHVSGGHGLVTLRAAKLAMEGKTVAQICQEVERVKPYVQNKFIMPGAEIFYQNGRTSRNMMNICKVFELKPVMVNRNYKMSVSKLVGGNFDMAIKRFVRICFGKKKKVSTDIVYITHAGCSVKQQEFVIAEVAKNLEFKHVVIQKASFTTGCNAGIGSIGIAYYKK